MSIWANIRVQLYMWSVNDINKTLPQWFYDQVIGIETVCEEILSPVIYMAKIGVFITSIVTR